MATPTHCQHTFKYVSLLSYPSCGAPCAPPPTFIIFPSCCYLQPFLPAAHPARRPLFHLIYAPLHCASDFVELCIIRPITPPVLNSLFAAESLIRSRMSRKPPVIILPHHCLCVEFCRTPSGVLLSIHRRPPGVSCSPALSRYFKCILQTQDFIFYTKAIY